MPAVVFVRVAAGGRADGRRGGFLLFDRHRVRLLLLQEHTPVTLWGGEKVGSPSQELTHVLPGLGGRVSAQRLELRQLRRTNHPGRRNLRQTT